jgi:hypothetical protein
MREWRRARAREDRGERGEGALNFRDMPISELIAYIRRAASAWFNDAQLNALEELIPGLVDHDR